jgi:hypothetical protein
MPPRFSFRSSTPDDAPEAAALYARLGCDLPGAPQTPGDFERLIQTGNAFIVAEQEGHVAGAVRHRDEDGIGWLDLLVSGAASAGPALVRAVDRWAQDCGLRLVRMVVPANSRLSDCFARWGYLPISREQGEWAGCPQPLLTLEKRLPLLTVREQRREDAAAIGNLTGQDPWVFEQGARPGVFVAADGDRVIGTLAVRDGGAGLGRIEEPALRDEYRGRRLELWMIERCVVYAETHGYHTAELPASAALMPFRRALEDRRWELDGTVFRRRFRSPHPEQEDG